MYHLSCKDFLQIILGIVIMNFITGCRQDITEDFAPLRDTKTTEIQLENRKSFLRFAYEKVCADSIFMN